MLLLLYIVTLLCQCAATSWTERLYYEDLPLRLEFMRSFSVRGSVQVRCG